MGLDRRLRLASRGTPLALAQAEAVASWLRGPGGVAEVEVRVVRTRGDRLAGVPLWQLGGQGVFVAEVRAALVAGEADLAVHSAKDLPVAPVPGLVVGAVPTRADPRDVLIGGRLGDLPVGALVASGAPRRRAQLAWWRPDLRFVELRGSIATRLSRLGEVDAVVVAAAALERLGAAPPAPAEVLPTTIALPQVGQGALAVECREDDQALRELLAGLEDPASRRALDAERAFLAAVGGGCQAAVGAWAREEQPEGPLTLEAMVASPDGHLLVRRRVQGRDPAELGARVAAALRASGGLAMTGSGR
jgi:hydroxymethylbilane synthase